MTLHRSTALTGKVKCGFRGCGRRCGKMGFLSMVPGPYVKCLVGAWLWRMNDLLYLVHIVDVSCSLVVKYKRLQFL